MDKIFKKNKEKLERHISEINKYSKKNSNIKSTYLLIVGVSISIVFLKFTRSMMIKLPSTIFYAIVIGILIIPFIISIIKITTSHKKYMKKIDKNIKNIYESLNNIYDDYEEKIIEEINKIDINTKIISVDASTYIYDDKLSEYELNQNIFKEKENEFNKEIYLDNEDKVRYLEEAISIIEDFQNSPEYKKFEVIRSGNLITQYLPDCDYKETMANINQVFRVMDNYYKKRKQTLINIKKPLDLGLDGEKFVDEYLKIYEDEIINLSNIRLEVDGMSIENDNILITRKGIFILEVKNIGASGSYSILIENDGRWIKKFSNNSQEVITFNATEQNDRHIAILQKFINNKLNRSIQQHNYLNIEGVVVIANNTVDIKNESMQNIYRISEIYRYINKFDDILSYDEMLKIKDIILEEKLQPKKYPILNYKSEINHNTRLFYDLINRLDNEKQNLCNVYEYLNESGYIECCEWLNDSNILREFKFSKFSNSVKKVYIPNQVLESFDILSKENSINIKKIDFEINQDKPKISRIAIILILSIILSASMGLFYKPGELRATSEGYVDDNGKIRIKAKEKYTMHLAFSDNGVAKVQSGSKWGLIDILGNEVVETKYDDINFYDNGLIAVNLDGKWGFINSKGVEIVKPKYKELKKYDKDLICVNLDGKWGIIDENAKEVVEPVYQYVSTEQHMRKYIVIKKDGKYGLLNRKTLEIALDIQYQGIIELYSYEIIKIKVDNKWGILNRDTLEELLVPTYQEMGSFDNNHGVATVKLNNKWGLIDSNGKLILEPEFDYIDTNVGEDIAYLEKDDREYYMKKDGKIEEFIRSY